MRAAFMKATSPTAGGVKATGVVKRGRAPVRVAPWLAHPPAHTPAAGTADWIVKNWVAVSITRRWRGNPDIMQLVFGMNSRVEATPAAPLFGPAHSEKDGHDSSALMISRMSLFCEVSAAAPRGAAPRAAMAAGPI